MTGAAGVAIAAAVFLACFPVSLHKTRYGPSIRIAPQIDPIVAQAPGEVISVRQDVASLLFYSDAVTRVTSAHGWPFFRELLSRPTSHRRYCLIAREDWESIDLQARGRWQTLLDDGNRLFVREEPAPDSP